MKLIHLSDLHIGKRLNEVNLIEDQAYIIKQILEMIREEMPDGILIAGDVYDKALPSSDAVKLFDSFLSQISTLGIPCFIISGNHDSPERIAFGASIMANTGMYLSRVFDGNIQPITLADGHGMVNIYMMPFIKPVHVKQFYPEAEIETYEDAIRYVIQNLKVDTSQRNILVMHQFVTAMGVDAERSDSESISVGGADNIDYSILDEFDYVALGHLHKPQRIGRDFVRYSGSPLKYSFSESMHRKSMTLVTIEEKGNVKYEQRELIPMRDLRKIKGTIDALLDPKTYTGTNVEDYLHVTLTDETEIIDALGKMRQVYPNVLMIEFDNNRSRVVNNRTGAENIDEKSDLELFSEFYELQNNESLKEEELQIVNGLLEKIGGALS